MKHTSRINKSSALYSLSVIAFFSALHASLTSYYNSSFLSTFTDEKTVSLIYLLISAVTIVGFLGMNTILKKIGNLRLCLALILVQIVLYYGLITTDSFSVLAPVFVLAMSVISFIALTLDIFLQKSTDIGHTGSIRGLYMTALNGAWLLGPLLGGMLIADNDYSGVYIGAFALLFPLLYLVHKNFKHFHDAHYIKISARETLMRILRNRDITKIFLVNISLQTFYAWMTVYTPIYLRSTVGFSWTEISLMFTIMLIPFVVIELPLGKLADKKWGEKEMLIGGFIIMALSTGALALFPEKNFIIWTTLLLLTRVGAAAAEVMIETYFFKKIDGRDPEILSMFRVTRPLSYFVAPVVTTIGLVYTTDQYLFTILGIMCALTLIPLATIRDTN